MTIHIFIYRYRYTCYKFAYIISYKSYTRSGVVVVVVEFLRVFYRCIICIILLLSARCRPSEYIIMLVWGARPRRRKLRLYYYNTPSACDGEINYCHVMIKIIMCERESLGSRSVRECI